MAEYIKAKYFALVSFQESQTVSPKKKFELGYGFSEYLEMCTSK